MKLRFLPLALALLCGGAGTTFGQLNVRVSVKFILNASGQRPSNGGGFGAEGVDLVNSTMVTSNINYANELMRRNGRGYQYQLTEIRDVSGWSGFFNLPARDADNRNAIEAVATSNATTRAQFFWRNDAINIYINNTSSGICSFPGDHSVIFVGSRSYNTLLIHEMGHYFNLSHTHEGEQFRNANNTSCDQGCACARLIGGNSDGVADTLPDHECWDRADIVANNPGATAAQVDNLWLNIMSYHLPQDRFTSDQMDRWTDAANGPRFNAVSGRTRFVDRSGNIFIQNGSSALPFLTVNTGVNNAAAGDIVLLRRGNYDETPTITKAVTLRASRGDVFVGRP